jgi:hypothetical protein
MNAKNAKYSKNTQEPLWQELRETIVIYMKKKQTNSNMYICKIIDIKRRVPRKTDKIINKWKSVHSITMKMYILCIAVYLVLVKHLL